MQHTQKIAVIINSAAGSVQGQDLCQTVVRAFERQGTQAQAVMASGDTQRQVARAFRDEGFSVIVAGGGDGTISAVAAELVGQEAALGVLPLGTLNHFAGDLGIPTNLEDAVTLLCTGKPKAVDVGIVNGLIFLNNASLGLYPDQVRIRQRWQAKIGKWPALILASLLMLFRFPYLLITAEFNGTRIRRRCPMLVISNNEYVLAPGNLTQREQLDGGTLGLYLLQDVGRAGVLRLLLHSMLYKLEEAASVESHRATEIIITPRRKQIKLALDGEIHRLASPLHYRVMPGSLRVIAPS
ncbi:MAG: diacylglycerol/lipid kinase family protein [Candidatus Binatia bacterium]